METAHLPRRRHSSTHSRHTRKTLWIIERIGRPVLLFMVRYCCMNVKFYYSFIRDIVRCSLGHGQRAQIQYPRRVGLKMVRPENNGLRTTIWFNSEYSPTIQQIVIHRFWDMKRFQCGTHSSTDTLNRWAHRPHDTIRIKQKTCLFLSSERRISLYKSENEPHRPVSILRTLTSVKQPYKYGIVQTTDSTTAPSAICNDFNKIKHLTLLEKLKHSKTITIHTV